MRLFLSLIGVFLLILSDAACAASFRVTEAQLSVDQQTWQTVQLGDAWSRAEPARNGLRYYKIALPKQGLALTELYLLIPKVGNRAEVFLNHQKVATIGDMANPDQDFSNKPYLFALPVPDKSQGNFLQISVAGNPSRFSGLSHLYLGDKASLTRLYERQLLATSYLYYFVTLVSLVIGVVSLVFYSLRRNRASFQIAMAGFLWAASVYLWSLDELPCSFTLWLWGMDIIYGVFLWFTCQATLNFLGIKKLRYPRFISICTVLFCLGASYNALMGAPEIKFASDMISVLAWCYALYNIWLQVLKRRTFANLTIAIAGLAMLPIGLYDVYNMWLSREYDAYAAPYYTHLILLIYILALTLALMRHFDRALKVEERYRKKIARSLARKNRELERLYGEREAAIKLEAMREERERIVRDIHDGVGSNLVTLLQNIRAAEQPDPEIEHDALEALSQLRMAIDAIDPVENDPILILSQIRYRMQTRLQKRGIRIIWQVQALPDDTLHVTAAAEVSFILMEAFANIIKHAKAKTVTVSSAYAADQGLCTLRISDDGVGISGQSQGGRGLSNMQLRAEKIGARLDLQSDGKGTTLTLSWLVQQAGPPPQRPANYPLTQA